MNPLIRSSLSFSNNFNTYSEIKSAQTVINQNNDDYRDEKYKVKCELAEKQVKELIFLNAALQNQIDETKVQMSIAKNERKFFLDKLLTYEKDSESTTINSNGTNNGKDHSTNSINSNTSNSNNIGNSTAKILQQVLSKKQSSTKKSSGSNSLQASPSIDL